MPPPRPTLFREHYRYSAPGCRAVKTHAQRGRAAQVSRQQVRYLPGLEMRTAYHAGRETENLRVVTLSGVRILRWLLGRPEAVRNGQRRFSVADRTGSSLLELDGAGNVISREQHYPSGGTALWTTRNQTQARYKTLRYSGKERDITGLMYYGWRYYAPWLMRWINPDPAGDVNGLNIFIMAGNNPETFSDADGRMYTDRQGVTHMTETEAFERWMQRKGDRLTDEGKDEDRVIARFHAHVALGDLGTSLGEKIEIDAGYRHVCPWPGCDYKTNSRSHYKVHQAVHSGARNFECDWPGCGQRYSQPGHLHRHQRTHTGEKYACERPGCDRRFFRVEHLHEHLAQHDNQRAFECPDCDSAFNTQRGLKRHRQTTHVKCRPFRCAIPDCDKSYPASEGLAVHMQAVHAEHRFRCQAPDCGLTFPVQSKLQEHQTVHSDARAYSCRYPGCNANYKQSAGRARHEHKKHGGLYGGDGRKRR